MPSQRCGMSFEGNPADGFVSGDLEILDDVQIGQDLTISGNLTVSGTTTTIDTESLICEDPMVLVGADNQGNLNDGGIILEYDAGTSAKYSGLVRDKSDGNIWKVVDNLTSQPPSTSNNSSTYNTNVADLRVKDLTVSQNIDRFTPGTLNIANSTADKVEIARSGVVTEIFGNLLVQERIDSEGSNLWLGRGSDEVRIGFNNDVKVRGPLRTAQSIDRELTGVLDIGGGVATDVNISRTGQTTSVKGSLQVDNTINATGKITAENFGDDANRNLFIGEINDPGPTGTDNTSIGLNTGDALTSGGSNVLIGNQAASNLTTGDNNVCIGINSGQDLVSAVANVFVGPGSGRLVTSNNNTAVGVNSGGGTSISGGGDGGNTSFGLNSLRNLTSGAYNTAIGGNTFNNITNGSYNIGIGGGTWPNVVANTSYNLRVSVHDGSQKDLINGQFNTGTLDLGQANTTSIIKTLGTTDSTSETT